jgi:tripartite-type tricarboxylate transporter receptor subunit TctC
MKLFVVLIALCVTGVHQQAQGQGFPSKPIRFINSYAAGGPVDMNVRPVAQRLQEALGQPVITENRPGANGNIAAEAVAKSPPDGYTLLAASTSQLTINPGLYPKLPYSLEKDLAPITLISMTPTVMVVHPSVPVKTVKDFISLAQKQPGKLGYASAGNGSINHLSGRLLMMLEGIDLTHVPYKGGQPALIDVVGGHVEMMIISIPLTLPFVKAGRLKPLAVSALKRVQTLPDVPTMKEAGVPGLISSAGVGLMAPAATPKDVIAKLQVETAKALESPEVRQKLAVQGLEVIGNSPEAFATVLREETARWAKVIKAGDIKPN